MYLTSINKELLEKMNEKIWIIKIKEQADKDLSLLKVDSIQNMTDDQIAQLKIYSINAKIGKLEESYTEKWAEIKKVYNQDKWYMLKPDNKYMINVDMTDIQEEEYNKDWEEPILGV